MGFGADGTRRRQRFEDDAGGGNRWVRVAELGICRVGEGGKGWCVVCGESVLWRDVFFKSGMLWKRHAAAVAAAESAVLALLQRHVGPGESVWRLMWFSLFDVCTARACMRCVRWSWGN